MSFSMPAGSRESSAAFMAAKNGIRDSAVFSALTLREWAFVLTVSTNGDVAGKYDTTVASGLAGEPVELDPQPPTTTAAASAPRSTRRMLASVPAERRDDQCSGQTS